MYDDHEKSTLDLTYSPPAQGRDIDEMSGRPAKRFGCNLLDRDTSYMNTIGIHVSDRFIPTLISGGQSSGQQYGCGVAAVSYTPC
jgi:hypothetical protein